MDAAEQDRDVVIQKHSSELIADFDRSLTPFLRKPNGQLRSRVRTRESARLASHVLEPFQELPQLLDPHLPRWLPTLAEAYLESLNSPRRHKSLSMRSQLLLPLPNAICMIIYTLAKIRGEKVVVRFLNVETRYLELLLLAIEDSERRADAKQEGGELNTLWTWHERYVVLLWLSQLFFAPFDLATISSGDADDFDRSAVPGFEWLAQIPGITLRVIPLAIKYLASPGKERDGAKALLVRLSMRKDMQELGILRALVRWCLSTLRPKTDDKAQSSYYYIGSLAFLSGVLRASDNTSILDGYLLDIFNTVQAIATEDGPAFKVINGSASARKLMIKIVRSVATLVLRKSTPSMAEAEVVEVSIGYMLERLADNDTPVRLAASKGLSIITFKLEPDMASEVIQAVLESLNRNVLWVKNKSGDSVAAPTRDLTAVDPLEWHGLMLTLSHLLYRRSPPPDDLSDIIHALLLGLAFEKRSASGGSIGSNVRDASCFGIWALARRYSTAELDGVQTQSVLVAKGHDPAASILQVIATELVVTAALDPAGNIRRGASAALQELIGRHPDTIANGISVVQVVDYHAVALRSRAINEVALQATKLSLHYGRALLDATLGWRGIGDMDAGARRAAASSFGTLTSELAKADSPISTKLIFKSVELLVARLGSLQNRQVEERHGLLLSLAAVFDSYTQVLGPQCSTIKIEDTTTLCTILRDAFTDTKNTKYRRTDLIAEAAGQLATSSLPILLLHTGLFNTSDIHLQTGQRIMNEESSLRQAEIARAVDGLNTNRPVHLDDIVQVLKDNVMVWLDRNELEVIRASSEAASVLVLLSDPKSRSEIVKTWCERIQRPQTFKDKLRSQHGNGFYHALTRTFTLSHESESGLGDDDKMPVLSKVLAERWAGEGDVEARVAILQSLVGKAVLRERASDFMGIISEGLDDYTTNARGDIGSLVRVEAIRAIKSIWDSSGGGQRQGGYDRDITSVIYPRILRIAAEKLDRVRAEAQSALLMLLHSEQSESFRVLSFSSEAYFTQLFSLCDEKRLKDELVRDWPISVEECMSHLLAGLATSADTGNEDLVVASRAALVGYCEGESSSDNLSRVGAALIANLKSQLGSQGQQQQDRVVVPTLEVVAFLSSSAGLLQRCSGLNMRQLCLLTQRAAFKTGNVRKLESCVKVYGAIAAAATEESAHVSSDDAKPVKRQEGAQEARRRLGALLYHPWPKVRTMVVDELWTLSMVGGGEEEKMSSPSLLTGIDWAKMDKTQIKKAITELGLDAPVVATATATAS